MINISRESYLSVAVIRNTDFKLYSGKFLTTILSSVISALNELTNMYISGQEDLADPPYHCPITYENRLPQRAYDRYSSVR